MFSKNKKLPVILIEFCKDKLDQMIDLTAHIHKEWDFRTKYSIGKDICEITLSEVKRKDEQNGS